MANFALLDDFNVVQNVIVIVNDVLLDEHGVEQEHLGIAECVRITGGGRWVQTSVNRSFRGNHASIGMIYNEERDLFLYPKPYPSWILDDNYQWVSPVDKPDPANHYEWDESSLKWVRVNN